MQLQDETQDKLPLEDDESGEPAGRVPAHGIWIAVATFVPAFLTIFFGIPYLAASRIPVSLQRSSPPVVLFRLLPERGFVGSPPQDPAPMMPSKTSTQEVSGIAIVPSPTLATPREAAPPPRPQGEPDVAEPKRSAPTVTRDAAWVRGAAFSDQISAERFAASVEQQGYLAKIRRDNTSSISWVVWIGQHPRATTSSEKREPKR
jgi:hypothetical protein